MRLAHLADPHLGFRQFDRAAPGGMNQREADVSAAFVRAVDGVIAAKPGLVILAGDQFHHVRPTNQAIVALFEQLRRLRAALPAAPVVMIAGNHDTPRLAETGVILQLYAALGVHLAVGAVRRWRFPEAGCAVVAVPHNALMAREARGAPEPDLPTVLVTHGEAEGIMYTGSEHGGAVFNPRELSDEGWAYAALGHYHVATECAPRVWYAGSPEYVSSNPWGELKKQAERGLSGKGWLLVDDPAAPQFMPIDAPRVFLDLEPIDGAGLSPAQLDAAIAERVAGVPIDGAVVRLLGQNIERPVRNGINHAAVRALKARALNFHLDLRSPPRQKLAASSLELLEQREPLSRVIEQFMSGRADRLEPEARAEFLRLSAAYLNESDENPYTGEPVGHMADQNGGGPDAAGEAKDQGGEAAPAPVKTVGEGA